MYSSLDDVKKKSSPIPVVSGGARVDLDDCIRDERRGILEKECREREMNDCDER